MLNFAIETGFVLIGLAMTLNLWRLMRGPDATDRILALDTMTINAIANADWPVVQGLLLIQAFLVVFSNLLSDVLYAVVDPRIQFESVSR